MYCSKFVSVVSSANIQGQRRFWSKRNARQADTCQRRLWRQHRHGEEPLPRGDVGSFSASRNLNDHITHLRKSTPSSRSLWIPSVVCRAGWWSSNSLARKTLAVFKFESIATWEGLLRFEVVLVATMITGLMVVKLLRSALEKLEPVILWRREANN